jgi:hypothetical protein
MRTRISFLIVLLWGLALTPASFGQGQAPPTAPYPVANARPPANPASANTTAGTAPGAEAEPPLEFIPYVSDQPAPPADQATPLLPVVRGQDYAPPDPVMPLPLYSTRPENGGLYTALRFIYYQESNPLHVQTIAYRGFVDVDGSITGTPGTFVGSKTIALTTAPVTQSGWTFDFGMTAGWRFRNGTTLEFDWLHFDKIKYIGGASLIPPSFNLGPNLADSFLFAPVFNFPSEFAGPTQKVDAGNPGATFGIWNAASVMTIQFTTRFDQYDLGSRVPVYQDDWNRCYGLVSLRNIYMVDKFTWRTVSQDVVGNAGPQDVAIYSNEFKNNMFGPTVGCGDEWRLGDSPMGTFALQLDLRAGLFVDFAKNVVKYERSDRVTASKFARNTISIVPELQATPQLAWYPIEGMQLKIGYDFFALFNTLQDPAPVDFNFLGLQPTMQHVTRYFNGVWVGMGLIF